MDVNSLRQNMYLVLAQLLKQPDQEFIEYLASGQLGQFMQDVIDKLPYELELPINFSQSGQNPVSLEDIRFQWQESIGLVRGKCKPIESLYKQWTRDKSCQLGIAKQKGWLGGDWACHMKLLLKELGIQLPVNFTSCPDHLIVELELMALFIEHATVYKQLQFMENHLDWLDELNKQAKEKEISSFYLAVLELTESFVASDIKYNLKLAM